MRRANPLVSRPEFRPRSGPRPPEARTLLDALRTTPRPDDPLLLTPDGAWSPRALLRASDRVVPASGRACPVPAVSPVGTVVHLLAAQRVGAVPVVAPPDRPGPRRRVLEAAARLPDRLPPALAAEPLLVVPTSGTSGSPRAVVRTCRSWTASLAPFTAVTGIQPDDLIWIPGTGASTLVLFGLWHALSTGTRVLATGAWRGPGGAGPAAPDVTVTHAVPAVTADLLATGASGGLPRLRTAVVAGAAVPPALRTTARGQGVRLVEYYGAAELSFVAVDPDGRGLRAFPGVEIGLRDGRVVARSPYLAVGYLDPRQGGPMRVDEDGWTGVGDRAGLDDGVLAVHGRDESAISVGGHTVLVEDVESVLHGVAGVHEVVCVGLPHPRFGQVLVAVVEAEAGCDPGPALRRRARAELPSPARPVRWVSAPLPRTASGKVDRAALRAGLTSPQH